MADVLNPSPPPPSPSQPSNSNLAMFYYGPGIVTVTMVLLLAYNLIVVKWCANRSRRNANGIPIPVYPMMSRNTEALPSFKYKEEEAEQEQGVGVECAVCLSVFEQDEEIKQLPGCKHSFHAPCIDMWLYSHFDCPLCRAPLDQQIRVVDHIRSIQQRNSQERLSDSRV
ncbi:hypothetical protein Ancab_017937 [Ancistrocladus abbreviatus]